RGRRGRDAPLSRRACRRRRAIGLQLSRRMQRAYQRTRRRSREWWWTEWRIGGGAMGLTTDACVHAIAEFGFTDRQARFLDVVMRHAGVCVPRQFATFAGIANGGAKCNALFAKLVNRGYAVKAGCVHNRAGLYHVRYKPLYCAIGEGESRYRRPVPARRAVERLMLLDGVLASPNLRWLTTEPEKRQYVAALTMTTADAQGPDVQATAPP